MLARRLPIGERPEFIWTMQVYGPATGLDPDGSEPVSTDPAGRPDRDKGTPVITSRFPKVSLMAGVGKNLWWDRRWHRLPGGCVAWQVIEK